MSDPVDSNREIPPLALVRGDLYAKPRQIPRPVEDCRIWSLDRAMCEAFAAIEGADGNVPKGGIYKVRAGERFPHRSLARRFVEARAAGAPLPQVVAVLDRFRAWVISDLYGDGDSPTPVSRRAA